MKKTVASSLLIWSLQWFVLTYSALEAYGDRKLNSYPMILSHDAASGELVESRDHIVSEWSKTQSVGLVAQLECGSRSFDYRPYLDGDMLYAHHGGVVIRKPMEESLQEVSDWCESELMDELVIFYVSSFDGDDGCHEKSVELLESMNIFTITSCDDLHELSYASALEQGKIGNSGGSLMAIVDCTDGNYDSTINCYGQGFVCYDSWPEGTSDIPWDKLKDDLIRVTSQDPTLENPNMWMAQAHWQSTALSVSLGTLHNSSLLLDEMRSGVNAWVESAIYNGTFPYLNFLELDNVCDNGPSVYNALKKHYEL